MNSAEEGVASAVPDHINSYGTMSVEQMHKPPTSGPDLKSFLADPTPLGIMGFIVALTPFTCELMEFRGAFGTGAATVGSQYFFGGLILIIASVLQFLLGNTFVFVVFASFAAFWLSYATTLTPFYNAAAAYDPTNPENPGFYNAYGFFTLFMGLLCFIYLICSLRTNLCFVAIFLGLVLGFCLLTGTLWQLANGNLGLARALKKAAGACLALGSLPGWYFLFVQLLATVDFPLTLPIGDLSRIIPAASERKKTN
ncbi:GPR1/FUN34/yaaH family-domain-containing protein [Aspergillus caelatus]|uniref:GPR1/FUN34/yaaH family-domain-containing protein n=1 Tax=Aspergillus caelatus TaxID=61420 RepID=A0A5N6ZTK5_9EURO|nr:GPR1/FUN34/yaaH family-domain-containing protein [Aspergillus caelatus]KAE8360862.1 GPR1/FUN34/yaaH family-domain-containing protein [Aspergillus caelatus]